MTFDYSKLETWKIFVDVSPEKAIMRLSQSEDGNNFNPGTLSVVTDVFNNWTRCESADFFHKCEKMDLRGSRLWKAYAHYCDKDMEKFASCVNKSDKAMVDFLKLNA